MKTVLVFPPFYHPSLYNLPPLGLVNLATVLRHAGHDVSVLDLVLAVRRNELPMQQSIYQDAARMVIRQEPDLVGFSVQCATFPAVIRITELLRKMRPGLKIVLGGHDVSFVDQLTLERFPWIDAVVRAEGEITFRELANAYAEGSIPEGIEGVTWRDGPRVIRNRDRGLVDCLDDLPLPDYSFVAPLDVYRDACGIPRSIAILEVGRGCPHQCVYCSESIMWRRRSRTFSISRIVGEMHQLRDRFGAECFLLAYDQFTANRRFVENFCSRVLEEGLHDTPWYCISRLDSMDPSLLRLMRQAGCESMCYGIDSGSQRTLAFIRKQIDENILYQRVRETTDEGMVPTLSFVIGFPEEEREDIDKTLTLALKTGIQGNSNPLLQLPTVLPGTELYRCYGNRLVREADTYFSLGLEFDNGHRLTEDTRLIESEPLLFSSFYNLTCAGVSLAELNGIAAYFPLIINLYPKSFLLLTLATGDSVSCLFGRFLRQVQISERHATIKLSPEECRQHLPAFATNSLKEAGVTSWHHIPDIIDYETIFLELGITPRNNSPATADLCCLDHYFPLRNESIVIREYSWNLPDIINDLKDGRYRDDYQQEATVIAAIRKNGGIEVTEINDFGRDMLQLSDGTTPIEEIADALKQRYGQAMNAGDFLAECRAALAELVEMELVERS